MAKWCWFLAMISLGLALSSHTYPQSSAKVECTTEDSTSSCDNSELVLEHILVTATRREVPLHKVPLSVTALSGESLLAMGAVSFEDYARSVPGLSFTSAGMGGNRIIIRGLATSVFADARAGTAIYLDETPITNAGSGLSYSPDPVLIDFERVEVLRGPQGTLFGSGSMGGAIRLITKEPDVVKFEGLGEVILSNTEHGGFGYEARGVINLPVADNTAGIRAVAYYRDLDGWIDNTILEESNVNDNRTKGVRLAGSWLNQEGLTVNGKIVHQDRQSSGSLIDEGMPPWTQQRSLEEPNKDEWTLFNLNIGYEFEWGSLVSTTSWFDRGLETRVDTSPLYNAIVSQIIGYLPEWSFAAANKDDQDDFVQEFRLSSSPNNRLDWLLGFFYQDQEFSTAHDVEAPGFDRNTGDLGAIFGTPDKLLEGQAFQTLKQTALYADLIWPIGSRLEGHIGGRWFRFKYAAETNERGILNLGDSFSQNEDDETGFTPRIGASYFLTDNTTLYGTIANGFRPGGTNATSVENFPNCGSQLAWLGLSEVPRSFGSDTLLSYELGIKSGWAGNRLALRSALYYNDWNDIQTPAGLPCGATWIQNAGSATTKGAEIELAIFPVYNLELTVNGAYTDARLDEDIPNLLAKSGDQLPGAPRYAFGGSITWRFRFANDTRGALRADYQYVGESFSGYDFYRLTTPAHSLTNLRASLSKNNWEGTLFVNNVFHNRAIITVHDGPGGQYVTTARPFTVGVSLRYTH